MIKPKTLPFYLQNGDYLDILDNEDVIIATVNTHENSLEIGEYIEKACNNYPKAIELLKQINHFYDSGNTDLNLEYDIQWRINQFIDEIG